MSEKIEPWDKDSVQANRLLYLLIVHFRKHPPNKKSFTVRELAERFGVPRSAMYSALSKYRENSRMFLKAIPVPPKIKGEEESWNWALKKLHETGCFIVQPLTYHGKRWGEPTFRQYERYNTGYFKEGINRVIIRVEAARDFNLELPGLEIAGLLDFMHETRRQLLEGTDTDNEDKVK